MAIKASSLEEFLKNYRSKGVLENRPKSLYEYMSSSGRDPDRAYLSTMRAALTQRATSNGGYGSTGERLGSAGLAASGYREHLERLAQTRLDSAADAAWEARAEDYAEAHSGYESYLKDFKDGQTKIRNELRDYMTDNGIMGLEQTFALGIESGLSAEEAASLSAEVYGVLKWRVTRECLAAFSTAALDLDGIRSYAQRAGLIDEDVDALVKEARRYAVDKDKYSDEYLQYLEDQANKK